MDPPAARSSDARAQLAERLLEVATLGLARKSGPDRPWTSASASEAELVAAAESIARAEGRELARRMNDGAAPASLDAGAAFARAFVLGAGDREAAVAAARTLLAVRPEVRPACADGLALATGAHVGEAVVELLDDAPAAICAAALAVLRFRRQAPYAAVLPFLSHPSPEVAAASALALAVGSERQAAAAVLRYVLSRGPDDALALAAVEALLTLGDAAGLAFVRDELTAESSSPKLADEVRVAYLRLLGLAGDAADRELFFRSVEPGARDAAAVGWFGHPDLVEWLLGSLEAANDARRAKGIGAPSLFETAAARALQRILGTPRASVSEGAVAAAVAEPIVLDAGPWRSHWARARAELAQRGKLRFGRPFTLLATIDELEAPTSPTTRADAALELGIASRAAALLEPSDWVSRQRAVLTTARATAVWPPGTFPGGRLLRA